MCKRNIGFLASALLIALSVTGRGNAQTKGFTVEQKPRDVLEKEAGLHERYALLIGISKYANPAINLEFAAADAEALSKLLTDPEVGAYAPDNVKVLTNDQATRRNIVSALKTWLGNRVKPEDSVLVFYSGHGALGNASEAFWVSYDADVEDLSSSAIGNTEISSLIAALPAKRKLTLIDSCYSEATAKKYRALVPSKLFDDFKGEGVVTITASTGAQKSVEVGGHGAFAYHLLNGLQGKADSNGNGVVELDEIWTYLNEKVQKTAADAGNKQTPVLMADRLEHGFPLTINPAKADGAVLSNLKKMYADGAINADEMREADRIFGDREGTPELRKLYRDLSDKTLPINYFRQLRQVAVQASAAQATPVAVRAQPAAAPSAPSNPSVATGAPAPAAATGPDLDAFNLAQAVNTIEAWKVFLLQFPEGQLAAAARARVADLEQKKADAAAYNVAKQSETEKGWEQYLNQFPNGMYLAEAQRRFTELKQRREAELAAFRLAEAKNNESTWERFLKDYSGGQLAALAEDRLEALRRLAREKENATYATALKSNALEDWDKYITAYPDGRFIADATTKRAAEAKRLKEERQRKIENDTYIAARTGDSLETWGGYVSKYPAGPHTAEAAVRIGQLTWLAFADTVALPGGGFQMGSERKGDEKPVHRAELDPFAIGRAEVSNAQYLRFMQDAAYHPPADPVFARNYAQAFPDLPVVNVTYDDAVAFCKWLSAKTGAVVRLPTEAEWEYAAQGGKEGYRFPWGVEQPKTKARYKGNSPGGVKTAQKDAYPPNGFGLYNMSGNVSEWVSDFYSDQYYKAAARRNPTGPADGKERVIRGGDWDSGEDALECSRRHHHNPNEPRDTIGFRIVVVAQPYGVK
jgi:formylglycine-generating enzyme required for sulfatase activity